MILLAMTAQRCMHGRAPFHKEFVAFLQTQSVLFRNCCAIISLPMLLGRSSCGSRAPYVYPYVATSCWPTRAVDKLCDEVPPSLPKRIQGCHQAATTASLFDVHGPPVVDQWASINGISGSAQHYFHRCRESIRDEGGRIVVVQFFTAHFIKVHFSQFT